MEHITEGAFWVALAKIIWVNILLSGDNAVVIALAARSLPDDQRKKAIFGGSAAAIVLRIVLTVFAVQLLQFPYLKIVGALLLFWIGVQLLVPEDDDEATASSRTSHLWSAIRTILIADLVMSLDNVIGVAAAADGGRPSRACCCSSWGWGCRYRLIIFGSTHAADGDGESTPSSSRWVRRLLGYVAGEMLVTDVAVQAVFRQLVGVVVTIGGRIGRRRRCRAGRAAGWRVDSGQAVGAGG